MRDVDTGKSTKGLQFEYELDAPPEKVWRALSIGALREKWLPSDDLASADPVVSRPNEEIAYRIREDAPPFLDSVVTFCLDANADGGTTLRIYHERTDARMHRPPKAANNNLNRLMLAA
ncbi:MAG: polyketide cyclase [Pseudomonadota bacterium]